MNYNELKKILDNSNLSKLSFYAAVEYLENNIAEDNLYLFIRLLRYFKLYYTTSLYERLLLLLDKFKESIKYEGMNACYINYSEALINYSVGEYNKCIEACFKTRVLKDVNPSFKMYTECFLVSSLINQQLYKEAYEENKCLLESFIYEVSASEHQVAVNINMAFILIFLGDYDNAKKYLGIVYEMKEKLGALNQELDMIVRLLTTVLRIKFEGTYFTKEEVDAVLDTYVYENVNLDKLINFTENSLIHAYILDNLVKRGRKTDAYKLSKQYVLNSPEELIDYKFYKIYKESIDPKNHEEYLDALEKYAIVLQNKVQRDSSFGRYYYQKYKNYYTLGNQYNELKDNYHHDPLTKVFSRASFEEIKKSYKYKSLIYIDINKLKQVNDTYGHSFGDKYLIKFAQNLTKVFKDDKVYRIGGDEFVVISQLDNRLEICQALKELDLLPLYETQSTDKFSAGVIIPETKIQVSSATNLADKVLYDVKKKTDKFFDFYE
jgi:diguanylate cyclase (GGDEF)-like protein